MTARMNNLVLPLAQKATAMRNLETTGSSHERSSAVSLLIGNSLRQGDVDSKTIQAGLGIRTSKMAIRTMKTRTTSSAPALSANYCAMPTFAMLVQAYFDCRKHKRNTASALLFEQDLERNLAALYDDLISGNYQPGKSICFVITRQKPREVWAADFRDRIVHHLFYNYVSPRFYASFIADSCACIPGRGTLYASKRLESKTRSATQNWSKSQYYLKCDLANFFVAIDKNILRSLLSKRITEPWWMNLCEKILFHDPRQNYEYRGSTDKLNRVPAHKQLTNQPSSKGLPIGNLSSQFFANVYLNELDQFVKHKLKAKYYVRYVDDFVLLNESAQWLNAALEAINQFLPAQLNAKLNPSKTILQPVERGVDFVGHVTKPWRRLTRKKSIKTAIYRIENEQQQKLFETINSYFGLFRQASHSSKTTSKLAKVSMKRGFCVDAKFTKIYRNRENECTVSHA